MNEFVKMNCHSCIFIFLSLFFLVFVLLAVFILWNKNEIEIILFLHAIGLFYISYIQRRYALYLCIKLLHTTNVQFYDEAVFFLSTLNIRQLIIIIYKAIVILVCVRWYYRLINFFSISERIPIPKELPFANKGSFTNRYCHIRQIKN